MSRRRVDGDRLNPYKAAAFAPLCRRLLAILADPFGGEIAFSIPLGHGRLWFTMATAAPEKTCHEVGVSLTLL